MKFSIKIGIYLVVISLIIAGIANAFWQYEIKYALPTPVPQNLQEVCIGDKVAFEPWIQQNNKPMLLHFFNPLCPCSKFNMKEYLELTQKYGDEMDFRIVLQSDQLSDVVKIQQKYGSDIKVLPDPEGEISDVFGIYATPQAVILDTTGSIYYKGNYNKARFCTQKDTRFAFTAIQHLLAGETLPRFTELATIAYGCSLPSDSSELIVENSYYQRIFQPWSK